MTSAAKMITVEGIEGVGKSTQMQYIADYLQAHHISFITTREPGGTPLAEDIRHLVLQQRDEPVATDTELLLLFASRAQHLAQVIFPALARGDWVICDRFIDATYAYQGGGRKVDLAKIKLLENLVLENFSPHLTLLLDAPVELALARAKARSTASDRFEDEKVDFFTAVRQVYLARAQAEPQRIKMIDASQPLTVVQESMGKILKDFVVQK